MTDADRIARLETAVERLCDHLIFNSRGYQPIPWVNPELVKQYVRGDLETRQETDGVEARREEWLKRVYRDMGHP